jgi:hypothetical protein
MNGLLHTIESASHPLMKTHTPSRSSIGGLPKSRLVLLVGLAGLSAFSTLFGIRALIAFDHTPGAISAVPMKWPASSGIERLADRPELLVFVHPFCTCSDATIGELAKISARQDPSTSAPAITVLFFRPRNANWVATSLWNKAQDLPGARVVWDGGGREAVRFGALTSGYTLLYNSRGDLLFQGGVTGSRGHAGDNYGLAELLASLDSGQPARRPSQVFGCSLQSTESTETEGYR